MSGEGQLRVRDRFCTRGWSGLEGAAQGRGTALSCQSSKDVGTTASAIVACFLSGSAWSQELDSVILIGPFQLGIFYESVRSHFRSDLEEGHSA